MKSVKYLEQQRERAIKLRDKLTNDPGGGIFRRKPRNFVLKNSQLNLWENIRKETVEYFEQHNIQWWFGVDKKYPSGHLLSSQVACLNHLFALRNAKELATKVLQAVEPRIISAEKIDNGYIEFEVIEGENKNPLNEKSSGRKRGSLATSIDALMLGKKQDGKNILVLIEWKYTESYDKSVKTSPYYAEWLNDKTSPIKSPQNITELFIEPAYQLMRQTLLGWRMAQLGEYSADEYLHLHIIPKENLLLRKQCENWQNYLVQEDKYKMMDPKCLLNSILAEENFAKLAEYLQERYW
ncbi:MAG: hypothetical protein FWG68_05935 [Defluviitaleaceae bacterium]|nr:hypothetical protein [Defluviitaleaceae bacterium]